jgi:hypothetical protein
MLVLPYFRWNRKSDLKDKGRDGESNKAFPLTPALSPRERENHSARLEGPSAPGRSVVQVLVGLPWHRASMGGSKPTFPERCRSVRTFSLSPGERVG